MEVVNKFLEQKNGRVKSITPISKNVAAYGYAGGDSGYCENECYYGSIYAYVVVEYDPSVNK